MHAWYILRLHGSSFSLKYVLSIELRLYFAVYVVAPENENGGPHRDRQSLVG